jgi:hypothetical protein
VIDVYSEEAGPEEDWGFANFDRTICLAAVVTAWAALQDYLVRQLRESRLSYDLTDHPVLAKLVQEDVRNWDRRFDALVRRYSDFAGVALKDLPTRPPAPPSTKQRRPPRPTPGPRTRSSARSRATTNAPSLTIGMCRH